MSARPAKSHKADGTPKKRWTAAQRAARGRPPRRSSGRKYEQTPAGPRPRRREDPVGEARSADASRRDRDAGWNKQSGGRWSEDSRPGRRERGERPDRWEKNPRWQKNDRDDARSDRPARRWQDKRDGSTSRDQWQDRRDASRRGQSGHRDGADRDSRRQGADPRRPDRGPRRDRGSRRRSHAERWERTPQVEPDDQMDWSAPELTVDETAEVTGGGFTALRVPENLVRALTASGITEPFPIQQATIPDALTGRDVLGRGRTGSGKTLGFGLPLLSRLAGGHTEAHRPRGIVMVPTRELAMQVADVLAPLARIAGLSVQLVAGGMAYGPQVRALEKGVDILVATPGRLIDLMSAAADLSAVEITVLDEADHMADLGFLPDMRRILDAIPTGGQRMLFSATLDRGVDTLVREYLHDPVTHEVDEARAAVTTMAHHVFHISPADKATICAEIANRDGRVVVFVRTQRGADRVAGQLRQAGVMAGALHGGLTQGARARVLAAFKSGSVPVLVATDVAARGIHVDDVGLVLQADPPRDSKDYLHRAGRTARAGEEGVVVTLALPHQNREVKRMLHAAGVSVKPVVVTADDEQVYRATGARKPVAEPITDEAYAALIAPPAARPRGPRRGGFRRGDRRR